MRAFVVIDVVALSLFAWFCLVKVIPSCNVSMYRYRLWRLRDRLADEIREGVFEAKEQPKALLGFVEGVIVLAPNIGAVKLGVMLWSTRHTPDPEDPIKLDALSPGDKKLMEERLSELGGLTAKHVLLGSPSGWIVTFVLGTFAFATSLIVYLLRGAPDGSSVLDGTRLRVRDEIEVDRALVLLRSENVSRRSALQSV